MALPRRAIRRSLPVVFPRPARLARARAALWPAVGLAATFGIVLLLEASVAWQNLGSSLQRLDLDPGRVALIEAWLATIAFAALAALSIGRPWPAVMAATGFLALSYVVPLGDQLARHIPALFGVPEQVHADVIRQNQLVALAVGFLASIPAAATGDLLRRSAMALARAVRGVIDRRQWLPLSLVLGVLLGVIPALGLATGADPLVRYGPEHGVYTPRPGPARSLLDASRPNAPGEPVPAHGQMLPQTFYSQAMSEDRHYILYLPPSYGLRAAARRHYPTLYLLHGDPGAPQDWVALGAPALFDAGIAQGVLPETIVVMPDGNGHVTSAPEWADRKDGRDRIEDSVLELVAVIDRELRTMPERSARVVAGLSSGGFGAANLAARHPDVFGTGMSFSGYFLANSWNFGSDPNLMRANSPFYLVQDSAAARTVYYVLVVGAADPYYLRQNQSFADQLNRFGVHHELMLLPGGHGGGVWAQGLALGMARVAQILSRPTGVSHDAHDGRRL
jgi:enterochelin esterase-like enzyme